MNRITGADIDGAVQSSIIKSTMANKSENNRVFCFAQVIDNNDPENLNRIKCRIPVIDDVWYVNNTIEQGNEMLPWCVPSSNRFLETPEINSILMVAIFDTKVPFFGRIFFNVFSGFSKSDYFSKLELEDKLLSNWDLVEDIFGIKILGKPKNHLEFSSSKKNTDKVYEMGLRGKGKNSLIFYKNSIKITQNKGTEDETKIIINKDFDLSSSDKIDIISKKGNKKHYNPVFDEPLFDYLSSMSNLLKKLVVILTTTPAMSSMGPCTPTPNALKMIKDLSSLSSKFAKFKKDGSSKKISIN